MKTIPISNSSSLLIVDDIDYERVVIPTWNLSNNCIRATINKKTWQIARFILDYSGLCEVDHKDRNIFNNVRENLRIATKSQNQANRILSIGKSGFKGVRKSGTKWRASISVQGIERNLGSFWSAIDAAKAYNKAALKHYGEFAILNEVPNEVDTSMP